VKFAQEEIGFGSKDEVAPVAAARILCDCDVFDDLLHRVGIQIPSSKP
jgi:hypothetical protein